MKKITCFWQLPKYFDTLGILLVSKLPCGVCLKITLSKRTKDKRTAGTRGQGPIGPRETIAKVIWVSRIESSIAKVNFFSRDAILERLKLALRHEVCKTQGRRPGSCIAQAVRPGYEDVRK